MKGKFITTDEVERDQLEWGEIGWLSRPSTTETEAITVMEVRLDPGKCHAFHRHPGQEEVIYVMSGEVEQWLEKEKQILRTGDSIYIREGVVHASFNDSDQPVRFIVILGPCAGDDGYIVEELADQAPWNSLR